MTTPKTEDKPTEKDTKGIIRPDPPVIGQRIGREGLAIKFTRPYTARHGGHRRFSYR